MIWLIHVETEKTFRQIVDTLDDKAEEETWEAEEFALQKLKEFGFPMEFDDEDLIEQRLYTFYRYQVY